MIENLQKLKRKWQDFGCLDSGVEYLRARLRIGDISKIRVEAAACIGSTVAQRTLGGPSDPESFDQYWWVGESYPFRHKEPRWSRIIGKLGPEAYFRLGLAIAWAQVDKSDTDKIAFLKEIQHELTNNCSQLPPVRKLREEYIEFALFIWPEQFLPDTNVPPNKLLWRSTVDGELSLQCIQKQMIPWLLE